MKLKSDNVGLVLKSALQDPPHTPTLPRQNLHAYEGEGLKRCMHTVYVWLFLFDFQVTSTFVASRHGIANTKGRIHGIIYAMLITPLPPLNKEFL